MDKDIYINTLTGTELHTDFVNAVARYAIKKQALGINHPDTQQAMRTVQWLDRQLTSLEIKAQQQLRAIFTEVPSEVDEDGTHGM